MKKFLKLWSLPLLLAIATMYGLIAALVGDGLRDIIACIILLIPIIIVVRYYYFPNRD